MKSKLLIISLLILGAALSGCVQSFQPCEKCCSNSKGYTTQHISSGKRSAVMLTKESEEKLEASGYNLNEISDMTCLESLILVGAPITDITPLANLTNLKWLNLNSTDVSDISPVRNLTNLEYLGLVSTNVSDISPVRNLTNLESIDLQNTNVSDITPLENLTNLKRIFLRMANVSPADCEALKEKLPTATIHC